jgi:transcriptional regulator with XRE-family HTH domain
MGTPTRVSSLADRLRGHIERANQTEKRLADESGIPRTTLHRRLIDPSSFTLSELEAVVPLLGITLDELLFGDVAEAVSA